MGSKVWKCAGCGIEGPDTMRRCDCATNVVCCGREGAWKTDPPCPHCGKPIDMWVSPAPRTAGEGEKQ